MPPARKKAKKAQPPPTVSVGVAAKGRTFRVDVPAGGSAADLHRAVEPVEAGLATGEYIVVHKGQAQTLALLSKSTFLVYLSILLT